MSRLAKSLVLFVIVFHVSIFVLEALLWMHPAIHQFALNKWTSAVALNSYDRALVLRDLFFNQGFYNLFLAMAGLAGLTLLGRGQATAGYALIVYMCLSAAGAGLVLAVSTRAYPGALLQGIPAAIALALIFPHLVKGPSSWIASKGT